MKRMLLALALMLWSASGWGQETSGGTLNATQLPALSGDCASAAGTVTLNCNGTPHPGFIVNNWYLPSGAGATIAAGNALTANSLFCIFGGVNQKLTINSLGGKITTASAGGNIQLAVYQDGTGHRPGALIGNTGSQSTTSTGTFVQALLANKQVGPGGTNGGRDVWWCINADNSVAAVASIGTGSLLGDATLGSATEDNLVTGVVTGVTCAGANCSGGSTFNSWSADLTGSTWTDIFTNPLSPVILFKVNSVP